MHTEKKGENAVEKQEEEGKKKEKKEKRKSLVFPTHWLWWSQQSGISAALYRALAAHLPTGRRRLRRRR